jgi:hypothetical protein
MGGEVKAKGKRKKEKGGNGKLLRCCVVQKELAHSPHERNYLSH